MSKISVGHITRRHTRRRILIVAAIGLSLAVSFVAGICFEYLVHGHWYKVLDSRTYKSSLGTFHLRHVSDTEGIPFLDPGTSVLTFETPMDEVILFRTHRMFQESMPWVSTIQLDDRIVRWSDGQYHYSLRIEPMAPTTQP